MRMEETYRPKQGIWTEMGNTLDDGQGVVKYPPLNPHPVDIPILDHQHLTDT
jgi:hypothetical protein